MKEKYMGQWNHLVKGLKLTQTMGVMAGFPREVAFG